MNKTDKGQKKKEKIRPRARFPEFTTNWVLIKLGSFIESYIQKIPSSTSIPIYSSTREGLKKQAIYYSGRNLSNDSEYGLVPNGYFVYRHMSDDGIFKFNINDTGENIAVSKEYPVFKTINLSSRFLFYKLNFGKDFTCFALKQKKGGTRTRLYFKDLCEWKTLFPSLREQQKIADCLSSIDILISAQAKKIDELQTHKKGLLQHLFPTEGEIVPKLRFLEFLSSGKWEVKALGQICHIYNGKGISKSEITPVGKIPCIRYGELYTTYKEYITYVFSKTDTPVDNLFFSQKCDVIIPSSGETKIDISKASCVLLDNIALGSDLNIIRTTEDGVFLSYCINGPLKLSLANIAQGDTIVHLYREQLKNIDIYLPSKKEQKKIADCLSSLDELITAHTQKLDALKAHKKGLMQQLFPVPEETRA